MIPIAAPEEADSVYRLNAAQIIIMSSVPVPYMKVPSAVCLPRTATGKKVSMDYRRNKAKLDRQRTSRDNVRWPFPSCYLSSSDGWLTPWRGVRDSRETLLLLGYLSDFDQT